ncbi:MAG: sugar phosphate nucleotidyltransferase [Defluviitaleaceae bacterium]|nr:sugar phosphate nucleotidyltransferase [Defluviitaleaceae bacterium]
MKHKATKAIIMAAGKGNRLLPVTRTTPKPLISVNGKIMIESLLEALISNGIAEIYIVTGYLSGQFSYLPQKYCTVNITLLFNPYYSTSNNISSLYIARDYLGNCIIADSDFIINNPKILDPGFEDSGYCSVWVDETKEWLQTTDSNGYVLSCNRNGGKNGWQLFSISFWTTKDGEKLAKHLHQTFKQQAITHIYWDDIPMFLHKHEYCLKIRPISCNDLQEIDTLADMQKAERKNI